LYQKSHLTKFDPKLKEPQFICQLSLETNKDKEFKNWTISD